LAKQVFKSGTFLPRNKYISATKMTFNHQSDRSKDCNIQQMDNMQTHTSQRIQISLKTIGPTQITILKMKTSRATVQQHQLGL